MQEQITQAQLEELISKYETVQIKDKILTEDIIITSNEQYKCLRLLFDNCIFSEGITFRNINSRYNISFTNCKKSKSLIFTNCNYFNEENQHVESLLLVACEFHQIYITESCFSNGINVLYPTIF